MRMPAIETIAAEGWTRTAGRGKTFFVVDGVAVSSPQPLAVFGVEPHVLRPVSKHESECYRKGDSTPGMPAPDGFSSTEEAREPEKRRAPEREAGERGVQERERRHPVDGALGDREAKDPSYGGHCSTAFGPHRRELREAPRTPPTTTAGPI